MHRQIKSSSDYPNKSLYYQHKEADIERTVNRLRKMKFEVSVEGFRIILKSLISHELVLLGNASSHRRTADIFFSKKAT